jgi:hypothetical protein
MVSGMGVESSFVLFAFYLLMVLSYMLVEHDQKKTNKDKPGQDKTRQRQNNPEFVLSNLAAQKRTTASDELFVICLVCCF